MSDKDFLKFNNKQLNFSEFQQKLGNISEKDKLNLSKLLNIFDSDKNGLIDANNSNGVNEVKNLWDALKNAANKNLSGNNNELDSTELNRFGKEYLKGIDNAQNILTNFANTIFKKEEPIQTTETSNFKNNIELTETQAQNQVINTILDDVRAAGSLYFQQDNGKVSDAYDKLKEKDILGDKNLSATKVEEALALQEQTALNLISARDGELTKKEYYLQNKEHLKTMLLRRLYEKDENSGLNFLDRNKGTRTKEDFAKFLEDYIENKINSIQEIDSIKTMQSKLISLEKGEMEKYLLNLLNSANNEKPVFQGIESRFSIDETIPPEFNSDDPITFEEVFRYERGIEYSKEKVEQLISKTQERQMSIGAFNKFQVYKNEVNKLLKESNSLTSDKIIEFYQAYYENPMNDNLAKEKLSELIAKSKLPISLIETGGGKFNIDLSAISNEENKKRALVNLLKLGLQEQEKLAVEVLGGKPEDRILAINQDYQAAYNSAYGSDFTEEIVKAMEEDNKTFIQKYTGEASTSGMVLIGLGAVLCCTPLAPAGGLMLASGNALALGGMVAESALGTYEAKTRDKVDEAELEDLKKTAIMNTGGFIVGFGAGKLGMKVFNKLVDKKLAAIFKDKLSNIGRKEALKEVFTNPEMLKNFATAGGAKLSTDFLISYAGDLVMMGILDPKDNWESLLKSNLMGIMIGSASDIADVGKLAGKKKTSASANEAKTEYELNQEINIVNNTTIKNDYENIKTDNNSELNSLKLNRATLEDYEEIIKIFHKIHPNKYGEDWLLENVKTKDNVIVVKELINFQFKNGDFLNAFDIKLALPKLKNINDANSFLKDVKIKDSFRQLVEYYDTPYYNLAKFLQISHKDNCYFKVLTKVLDTPEKIKQTESELEKLSSEFIPKIDQIKIIYEKITGIDITANCEKIKNIIVENLGAEAYNKDFLGKIDIAEMSLQNFSQVEVLKELLKFYNEPFFQAEGLNRNYLHLIINDVLGQIENNEDINILKSLISSHIKYDSFGDDYCLSELKDKLETGEYFPKNKLATKFRYFLVNRAKQSYDPEWYINNYLNCQNKIKNEKMLNTLIEYYQDCDNFEHMEKILDNISSNDFVLEAFNKINQFNKSNPKNKILLYEEAKEITFLPLINNQEKLDYFSELLKRKNFDDLSTNTSKYNIDIDIIKNFIDIGTDNYKRQAVLLLLDAKYSDGSRKFDNNNILQIVKIINSEDKLTNLQKTLNKKCPFFSKKNINVDDFLINILGAKFKIYKDYLQKSFPKINNLNEYAILIKEDTDLELAIKLIENYKSPNLLSLCLNNKELKDIVLDIIKKNAAFLDFINIEKYAQEPNGLEKIKDLFKISSGRFYTDLNEIKGSSRFLTKNYLKELQNYDKQTRIKHFQETIPINDIVKNSEAGEIIKIGEKLYINDGKSIVFVDISEKTFNKLFPTGKVFNIKQGALGDCWLIATIDVLMQSPKGRAKLLSLFEENTNGDIIINLPNKEPIQFIKGKPYSTDDSFFANHVDACLGIRLLEEACAISQTKKSKPKVDDISVYTDIEKTMDILEGGNEEQGFAILLGDIGEMPSINNPEIFENILNKFANNPNYVLRTGINRNANIPKGISKKYNLMLGHAYNINGFDKQNKIVYVVNPHDTRYRIEIPLEEYKKYFNDIKYLKLN